MGAPQTLSPTAIARSFIAIYYEVAARMPEQLALLYGEQSALAHGPVSAVGPAEISAIAKGLPVNCGPPTIHTVDAQDAGSGVIVLVSGAIQGQLFTQAFLLERKPDEGKHKYVCANDMFRKVSDAPVEAPLHKTPEFARVDKPSDAPSPQTIVENPPEKEAKSATGNKEDVDVALPASSGVQLPPDNTPQLPPDNVVQLPPDNVVQLPPDNVVSLPADNAVQLPPDNVASMPPDNARPRSNPVQLPAENARSRNNDPAKLPNDNVAPPQPAPKPASTKPKSWAAIVSKPGGSGGVPPAATVYEPTPSAAPAPAPKPAPGLDRAPATEVNKPPVAPPAAAPVPTPASPPYRKDKGGGNGGVGAQHTAGGQHPVGKFGHKGAPRQFGPSAVLQLASCGGAWAGKHRELATALREEFGQYGHPVRHVEVKGSRGIVFVEYDTIEGVEAAVKAWKEPRAEGRFAGVPLAVSEKRYLRRPPQRGRGTAQRGTRRGGHHRVPGGAPNPNLHAE